MSTQDQARALMMRHHHQVKNRQQSLLSRCAEETGIENIGESWSGIQGKPNSASRTTYNRSHSSLS
ncbi:MAG: hypothetical protein WA933_06115 [Microcoleaceae cyanobacterium]